MSNNKRVILIILDSVGVGEMPDSDEFGDKGANTIGNIAESTGGLNLPNLQEMGLGNILHIKGVASNSDPLASYGKMMEASKNKDTVTGHWEIMGLITEQSFPVFPDGFPEEILEDFFEATGVYNILGNIPASGTVIIQELGEEHIKTGFPIVYTSGDSVFQIAAHEHIIPVDKLYKMCEATRKVCDKYNIGRVIARPFIGEHGNFTRTFRRKDFSMKPPHDTVLDILKKKGLPVIGIGKIGDVFAEQGITKTIHTRNNAEGMKTLINQLSITDHGLIFINLIDFDMLYGHRRDVKGYAKALEAFDYELPDLLQHLEHNDILIITADHGCDPTHHGTDHTREHVPLLVYSKLMHPVNLGIRRSFSDLGVSILKLFEIEHQFPGKSFF